MNLIYHLALIVCCCIGIFQLAWADADLSPKSVIVVTSNQRPVSNINSISKKLDDVKLIIQILNLDAVTNIEHRLSHGLPVDPVQARAMVDQRIAQIGRSQLDAELRTAYLPLGTMMAYALNRYPVIIFDRQAVIYGVTDLAQAINKYRQWVEDKQGGTANE
ncbi:TIGR03757 family integrating conjugative element protein [Oceanicoccus sp. KOV_DT_Chl]|uniref:TIGR03757 family integrating conjugative element protein n=1 Tax=Oceanicoccus sp. KOV_DT_Chl TaxID=1904639 RepID=UPI00135BD2B7|nr:TIGR03757 family integrating conjugative element protein [Oceanicoccus sp. KOV_DT_Chl]